MCCCVGLLPTGIVCITNLDPSSKVLSEQYFHIVEEFQTMSLANDGDEFVKSLNIKSTKSVATADMISLSFWL